MTIKLSQKREVWRKIGEEDVEMGEYSNSIVTSEIAVLWNGDLDNKFLQSVADLLKNRKREEADDKR